ncbi:MAG: NAD(+)/NADH kinase [Coriobacteriia bacterium]|nr:NAD(+)/NADH kinase [Coriobacteriia bacterium]
MGKTIVFIPNEHFDQALAAAEALAKYCVSRGDSVYVARSHGAEKLNLPVYDNSVHGHPDLIVALGGDGTILRAVREMKENLAPLLGIKFGKLGFLTGATFENAPEAIDAALAGTASVEKRNMVHIRAYDDSRLIFAEDALNEVVIGRGSATPVLTATLKINGHRIYTSSGDGLIVATATGSTAYALSAGGPLMSPDYSGLVVVPLASHTLVQRAVVAAHTDRISVEFPDSARARAEIILDGVTVPFDAPPTSLSAEISANYVEIIKLDSRLFYDTVAHEFFSGQQ